MHLSPVVCSLVLILRCKESGGEKRRVKVKGQARGVCLQVAVMTRPKRHEMVTQAGDRSLFSDTHLMTPPGSIRFSEIFNLNAGQDYSHRQNAWALKLLPTALISSQVPEPRRKVVMLQSVDQVCGDELNVGTIGKEAMKF